MRKGQERQKDVRTKDLCGNPDSGISGEVFGPELPKLVFGPRLFEQKNARTPFHQGRVLKTVRPVILEPRFARARGKFYNL